MKKVLLLLLLCSLSIVGYSQSYCTPGFYDPYYSCLYYGNNITSLTLNGESGTAITDAGACDGSGYKNNTSMSVTLYTGLTYSTTVNYGGTYNEVQAWIDYNNDGTFSSGESVFGYSYLTYSTATYSFTVPSSSSTGSRRMRIMVTASGYGASYPSLDPCTTSYYYGEVRDYTVNISNPPPTVTPTPRTFDFGYVTSSSTSTSTAISVRGDYLTSGSSPITVVAPTNYEICSTAGGTYVSSYTISYTGTAFSATNVYTRFVSPSTAGTYTGSLSFTGGGLSTAATVGLSGTSASACSGTITAGAAAASPSTGGPSGTVFTLTLPSATASGGLTYQWQSSSSLSGTYSNVSGATNYSYTTSGLTTSTYYRCVVTCAASSSTNTSTPVGCLIYCTPATYYGGCTYATTGGVTGFSINGYSGSIADAAGCSSSGYRNQTSLSTTLRASVSYTVTLNTSTTTANSAQVWIDFNGNGTFESTETVGGRASYTGTTTFSITIPTTAPLGTYRMRVFGNYAGYGASYNYPNQSPCPTAGSPWYYGEARDYTVTIIAPPPVLTATPSTIAFGGVTSGTSSSVSSIALSGSYLVSTSGNLTATAPSMYELSTTGTGGWSSSLSLSYTGGVYTGTVYVRFSPSSTGTRSGTVDFTGGSLSPTVSVAVSGFGSSGSCSGTPSIGSASASSSTATPTTTVTLTLPSLTPVGGLTYQWRSSSTGVAGSFTNIAGATNVAYTFTGISATTYYNCIVTCTSSGGFDSSGNATLTFALPSTTCNPSSTYTCSSTGMMNSVLFPGSGGTSISDGTCSAAGSSAGYVDRSSVLSATLYKGFSYVVTLTGSGTKYSQVWIDYNSDGTFQSTEAVGGTTGTWTTSTTFTASISASAPTGTFRMRVLSSYYYYSAAYPSADPCLASYYVDARDYTVRVMTSPPTVTATPTSLSFGSVPTTTTSSALSSSLVGSYLLPSSGTMTITAPTNFQICSTVGGTYVTSYTISYSGSAFSATSVFCKFVSPSTLGTYTGSITVTGGGLTSTLNIPVSGISSNPCTGTPTAGTASITPTSGTTTTSFALSLTGYSTTSGITFQWQSSTSAGGTYTNISAGTNPTYTVGTVSATTYYRCVVTCTSSGGTATSNVVSATVYCTPAFYYSCSTVANFLTLSIVGSTGSISDNATCTANYMDRTSLSCTLTAGVTYVCTTTSSSTNGKSTQFWIDFNDDGTFASSESVGGNTGFTTTTGNSSLAIPTTATVGTHRMRAIIMYNGYGTVYPSISSCPTSGSPYYYGNARDYLITIAPPPPVLTASPTSIAFGGVTVGGTSAASSTTITGSYLTPTSSGNVTVTAPNYFQVSPDGSTWYTSYTISYTSGTISSTPVYVNFSPSASGTFAGSVTITGGGLTTATNVAVSGLGATACSGTPTAGSAVISPTSGSSATTFALTTSGTSAVANLTYQWQSSSTGTGGSFTNISGATNAAYGFTGITGTTYFRCLIGCPSYGTDSTSNATATFVLPSSSCTPSFGYSYCYYGGISSFKVNGVVGSINDASSCSGGYQDRTSLTCTLYKNTSYVTTLTASAASYYNQNAQIWIDFNSDGTFQSTETVGGASNFTTSSNITIAIPATVPSGIFRMRVLDNYYYNAYPGLNPCGGTTSTSYYYGEARDYKVTITNPPPVVSATPVSLNFGNNSPGSISSTITTSVTGLYLLPTSGALTVTAPTNYEVSTTGTSGWGTSVSLSYTSGTVSATTVYVRFNAPSTTGTYTGSVAITGGGIASTVNVAVTGNSAVACTGTPTAGTASCSPAAGTITTPFTLSLTGSSAATGITYQWQSSTTSGGTYTNISGATSFTYSLGTISTTMYYRCVVTCTNSGTSVNSNVVTVPIYCTPAFYYGGCTYSYVGGITSFNLVGSTGSIADAAGCASTGYRDQTSLSCTLTAGSTYAASLGTVASNAQTAQVWIDFNDDGTFASSETVGGSGSFTYTVVLSLAIPTTSNTGTHRMRVVEYYNYYGSVYPSGNPCPTSAGAPYYGEARDYMVTIAPPPPSLVAVPSTIAFGGVIVGSSSGAQTTALTGSYLVPTASNLTITAPSNFQVSSTGSSWGSSYSIAYTGGTLATTTVYVRFNPSASTSYSGSVSITNGTTTTYVAVSGTGATACAGTPTAGTVTASPTSGGTTTAFNLGLSGTSAVANLTYQWQSSASSTFSTFADISGATNPTYAFTGISSDLYVRCKVTCPSYGTDSTARQLLQYVLPSASCTTTEQYSSSCYISGFSAVGISGELSTSISDAASCSGTSYQDRTSLSVTLYKATSYTVSMTPSTTSYNQYAAWWIDFNNNGTFETSELVNTSAPGFTTSTTYTIAIPSTVPSGVFRMRGFINYYYLPTLPCGGSSYPYYYGEGRDYKVVITNPPPFASASPASLSFGTVGVSTTSSALSTAVTGSFLLPTSGTVTVTAPTNYVVCSTVGGTYVNSYTISYSSGSVSSVPVYVKFNAPGSVGTYTGTVTVTGGGLASALNIPLTGDAAVACSGTPTAGTGSASPSGGTSGTSVTLSLSGTTVGLGISYQWQSATTSGGTYTNISGATNATYTIGSISSTLYYKCVVTCTYGGATATSNVITVPVYCRPATYYGCTYSYNGGMNSFKLNGSTGAINDATSCSTSGYNNRTSLSCTIIAGNTYATTIGTSASNGQSAQIWIDFNDDGTFASSESVGGNASFTYNGVVNITTSTSATTGSHVMRVFEMYNGYGATYNYPNQTPCPTAAYPYYYGEARDYSITIAPPPPAVVAVPTTIAFGGVTVGASSAAQTFAMTGNYLLPTSGNLTVSAPTNFEVSTTGTSGWASSLSVAYTGATLSSTTIYVRLTPPSNATYTGSVTITGGSLASAVNVAVSGTGAFACSGTPTAGTTVASPTSGSASTTFTLSLTGTSAVSGLTYQWISSSNPTGPYTIISGATNGTYGFSGLTGDLYYRCIVTCPSYGFDTSVRTQITYTLPAASCTPTWQYSGYCYYAGISSFKVNGVLGTSINDASSCTGSYQNRTSLSCILYKSNNYTVTLAGSGTYGYSNYANVWIDFNNNTTFETSELVNTTTTAYTTTTNFVLAIPSTVPTGTFRMRVMANYSYNPTLPCGGTSYPYYYGDGRDYKVIIMDPPPVVSATPTSLDFGTVYAATTSSALSTSVSGLFLLPTSGSLTITAPTNYSVSSSAGGTYSGSLVVSYTGGTYSATNVFVKFAAPSTTGTYAGSLTVTGGGLSSAYSIPVTGNSATPCTGTPSAGTISITPTSGTSTTTFVASLTGGSIGFGLTYQWQSSTSGTSGSFTNISGATNTSYSVTGLTGTIYYYCDIACGYSGGSASSGTVQAVVYCTPGFVYGGCTYSYIGGITSFNLNGFSSSITDAAGCSSTGYRDQTALSCSLRAGSTYTASIVTSASNGQTAQIYIDFDDDGTFSSLESIGGSASFTYTGAISITIPTTANTGSHRMRVVEMYNGYGSTYNYPYLTPCPGGGSPYYYGEARDYTVNILPPPPTVIATPTSIAFGGVLVSSTSGTQSFDITGSYLTPTGGTLTVTAPTNFEVSTTGTSGWGTSVSYSYSSGTLATTTVYTRFTPPAATTYTGSVSITGGGLASAVNVVVSGTGAGACSGTPTAGTASITPTSGSFATSFTLSLSGTTLASGLTYQWMQSTSGTTGTFTAISGATNATYGFTGISSNMYYNCVVTCPTYAAATSTTATATYTLPAAGCTPSFNYTGYCYVSGFSTVTLVGSSGTISDAASCTGSGYQDRTSLSCTLYKTRSYTVSFTTSASGYNEYTSWYIDYNANGTFETSELAVTAGSFSSSSYTVSFTVPSTVPTGVVRMRGIINYYYAITSSCPNGAYPYYYGEARDYKVIISNPPPAIVATPSSVAFGAVLPGATSTTQTFSIAGTYLLPSTGGTVTVTAPSSLFQVSNDGSSWGSSYSLTYTGDTLPATTVYTRFLPTASTSYSGSITVNGGGIASATNVTVTGNGASACSATPSAGTAVASPTTASVATAISLSLTGTSVAAGLTYQWQSSTDSISFSSITGATNSGYTFTGITQKMYYRCIVTCPTYAAATSTVIGINYTLPASSCTPSVTYFYCGYAGFSSIKITGGSGSINDVASCSSVYQDRTSLSTTLYRGFSYNASITTSAYYGQYAQFWIDFNNNGAFESTEAVGGNTSPYSTSTVISLSIPSTAPTGMFRMRAVCDYQYDYYYYPSMHPCMTGYYTGQARDYTIIISNPPPVVTTSPTSIAFGGVLTGGTSSAQSFTVIGNYLVGATGNLTVTAPSNYQVSHDGSTWGTSYSIAYTGSAVASDTGYVRFQPTAATSYPANVSITGGGLSTAATMAVNGTGAGACAGTPTAGTGSASPSTGSSSTTFTLSLSGTTLASGLSFQWKVATAAAGPYTSISGATNSTYTFSGLPATRYYKCFVGCPTYSTDSSNAITVNWALPTACTPSVVYTGYCYVSGFNAVKINGGAGTSINDNATCTGSGYYDRTSLGCTLYQGSTYTTTLTLSSSGYTEYTQWWIDFNSDGTFQSTETVGGLNGFTASTTISIAIPATAPTGIFRMRGVIDYYYFSYPSINPCMGSGYYYGEARDYTVTIAAQPPVLTATPTSVSFGGVLVSTTSTTQSYVLNGAYLTPSSGNLTVTAPSNFQISHDGSTWSSSYTVPYTGSTIVDTNYVRFQPTAASTYTGSITVAGGGVSSSLSIPVNGTGAGACSGTPYAGTASATPTSGTSATTFALSLAGTTVAGGLQFQWQTRPGTSGAWSNVSGATNGSYSFNGLTASAYYRCVVICSGSNGDTSSTTSVTFALPTPCTPAFYYGGCTYSYNGGMTGFNMIGSSSSIADAVGCSSTGYRDRTSLSASLVTGASYAATVFTVATSSQTVQVWIDFNDDGTFSSGESVGGNASFTGNAAISLTIPTGSTAGLHRMRVMEYYNGYGSTYPSENPCVTSSGAPYYGEARDYLVTIIAPYACSGTPAPGTTTATVASGCAGLATTLDISGLIGASGLTYQWQTSSTGAGGSFSSVSGATSRSYSTTVPSTLYYNCSVTCTSSTGNATSSNLLISTTPAPTAITGTTAGCVGTTNTLSNGTTGGTWSSSATGVATVNPTTGVVYGVSVGSATISYTTTGCSPATASYTVNNTVSATISGFTSLCVGGSTVLTNSSSGGTWSSANTAIATANPSTGRVYAVGAGTTTITYSNGCGTPATTSWTSNVTPSVITGPSSICVSNTGTFSDSVSGGTWSNTPTTVGTIDPSTGVFYASAITGTSAVTYSIGYCSMTTTATVGSRTPAAIAGPTSVCANATVTLTNDTTGGAWSSSAPTIATISSTGVVTGITAGSATITYSTGCGTDATRGITVSGSPVSISSTTACSGSTLTMTAVTGTGSYTYSWSGPLSFSSTAGAPTIASASTSRSGIYSVTATQGSCSATTSRWVSVDSTPVVSVSPSPASICPGGTSTLNLSVTSPAASNTNYALYAIPYAPVTVTTVTAGPTGDNSNTSVTLPFSFNFYGTAYSSLNISTNGYLSFGSSFTSPTVYTLPSTSAPRGMIAPFFHDLNATTGTINFATVGSAPNRKFVVNYNNIDDKTGGGKNSGQIVLYETSNNIEMFITKANTASNYSGVCGIQDASGAYATTVPGQNNANYVINNTTAGTAWRFSRTSYTYSWTPSASLSSSTSTSPVSSGLTTTQVYTVTTIDGNSGCTTGNISTPTVNVYTLPAVRTISPATGCTAGTNITLDSSQTTVSYQLYNGASTSGSPVTGTGSTISLGTITAVGTYSVVGTLTTGGCTSNMTGTTVVYTTPTAYNVTGGNGCSATGITIGLSGSQTGMSYQIFRDGTGITSISGTGGAISFGSYTTPGTYTVVATGLGSCTTTMTGSSVIYPSPTVYSVTGGNGCTATGVTVGLTGSETGVAYQLFRNGSPTGSSVSGTGSALSLGLQSTAGYYTVVATGSGSCQSFMTGSDTVSTTPTASITSTTNVCAPSTTAEIAYSVSAGSPSTYSIAWGSTALTAGFTDVTGSSLGAHLLVALPTGAIGAFNGTLTMSNGYCTSSASSVTINVYAYPTAAITSAAAPCMGYATTVVITGASGATASYRINGGTLQTTTLTGGTATLATASLTDTVRYLLHNAYNPACAVTIDTTVVIVPVPMVWQGVVTGSETDWSAAGNWSCGFVPTVSDDVLIPGSVTNMPTLSASGSAFSRNLNIATGATVTLNSGATLNVKGDLTNNGVVTGAGSLSFNGGVSHHVNGIGSIHNLEVNDAAGVTIDSGSLVTVKNTLNMSAGALNTHDSLVLASDSTLTARVTPMTAGTSINGNVKVMQYVQRGYRRYRFWSHPFSNSTALNQLQGSIDVTGSGGAANGFLTTASNAASVYRYNPLLGNSASTYDLGWRPFTSALTTADDSNLIHRYQGIRVFMRGAKGEGLGYIPYVPSPVSIAQWGVLNQGNQDVTMVKGTGAGQDYNLLGNPYASPVDIATVLHNAAAAGRITGAAFYIWDPSLGGGGQFRSYPYDDTTGAAIPYYLQANTAFEVRAAHNNDQLNFTESNKHATASTNLLKVLPEYLTLGVYDAAYHAYDVLNIRFSDAATTEEDSRLDAAKLNGSDFSFYSLSADAHKLSIDARPYKANSVVPLGINSAAAQDFIIKADNIVVPEGGKVYLHDKLLGKTVQLVAGTEYKFTITKDGNTQGDNRFELKMEPSSATAQTGFAVTMTPNPATDEVKIAFRTDAKDKIAVRVMDMTGVNVYHDEVANKANGLINIPLTNLASGVYMVEITSGDHKVVQRLVKE